MSGPIERAVGDKLKLTLQLHDGAESLPKRVFCTLKDELFVDIEPVFEVAHVGNGVFQENTKLMTNIPTLFAYFRVTESDGTTDSEDHSEEHDRYERIVPLDLSTVEIKPFALKGVVASGKIEGKISSDARLVGNIREENAIKGIISGNEIDGEVDGNNVKGSVS